MHQEQSAQDREHAGQAGGSPPHRGWGGPVRDNVISRTVAAPTFLESVEGIVVEVARAAEDADHHPDIDIRWRNVTLSLTTHDAGNALTALDFSLAAKIDEIAARYGA
ncbi:MAG: 4a-hydroxytetrahydrobiopterin dehydratase [Streptosporangiaceae bacterium]